MFLHYITKCDPDVCSKKLSAMYDKQFWLSCVDECRWLQQLSLVSCIQWLLNISWPVLEQTWSPLELRYQWSQVVSDGEGGGRIYLFKHSINETIIINNIFYMLNRSMFSLVSGPAVQDVPGDVLHTECSECLGSVLNNNCPGIGTALTVVLDHLHKNILF